MYLNPGNSGFAGIRNDAYVDKSGLIRLINETINTPKRLTCISRPRRFGKSFTVRMLCTYYDKTCDSAELFDDLEIAEDRKNSGTCEQHRNQSAEGAIGQIRDRRYPDAIRAYGGDILLVGNDEKGPF